MRQSGRHTTDPRFKRTHIPVIFANATTSLDTPKQGIYLWGPWGTGKTTAACALMLRAYDQGKAVRYATEWSLITESREDFGRGSDFFQSCFSCPVLLIDDIGKGRMKSQDFSLLYGIVDSRWANGLVTYFTSNYRLSELAACFEQSSDEQMAGALVSRISGLCGKPVCMGGKDKRAEFSAQNGAQQ
jgi:DNA replication protein DnaC